MTDTLPALLADAVTLHRTIVPESAAQAKAVRAQRDRSVLAAHDAGASYSVLAGQLGCSTAYVQVMVQRARGTLPPSRRVVTSGHRGRPPKEVVQHA